MPVGRPSQTSFKLLKESVDWWNAVMSDITSSSEVVLSTYMYDETNLHNLLMHRLGSCRRKPFHITLLIDREALVSTTPRLQRSRLKALHDAGAHVYLCKGHGRLGAYHRNAVICDKRYMVSGGSNFTDKSHCNKELGHRLTGQDVTEVLKLLEKDKAEGKLWDGKARSYDEL